MKRIREEYFAGKIRIMAQGFYGNRTLTDIKPEEVDEFISAIAEISGRTIIHLPDTECVLIYNKYAEETRLEQKLLALEKDNYVIKPTAFIPEQNIEIYSRCVVCRQDNDGNLISLEPEDVKKCIKYLAE